MKRTIALAALAVSSLSLASALIQAQTPAAPLPSAPGAGSGPAVTPTGSTKIAIIAFEVAVSRTNEFQLKLADLQKKWGPRQQQLKTAGDDLDNQTNAAAGETQADKLSEGERATRAKTVEDKRKELQRSFEDARSQEYPAGYAGNSLRCGREVFRCHARLRGEEWLHPGAEHLSPEFARYSNGLKFATLPLRPVLHACLREIRRSRALHSQTDFHTYGPFSGPPFAAPKPTAPKTVFGWEPSPGLEIRSEPPPEPQFFERLRGSGLAFRGISLSQRKPWPVEKM